MNITTHRPSYLDRKCNQGFTLIELLVTIAILAIIGSVAAPNVSVLLANQRAKLTASSIESALNEARIESVIRRQPVSVSYDESNSSKSITVVGLNNKAISNYSYNTKSSVVVSGPKKTIIFLPSKRVDKAITYTICDSNRAVTPLQVTVSAMTMIKVGKGGTC